MSTLNQFVREVEADADLPSNVVSLKDAKAKRIRELAQQWTENTLQLGRELKEARDTLFPAHNKTGHRPGWAEWLEAECGIAIKYAEQLIRVSKKFANLAADGGKVGISGKVLHFLSRDTIPDEGRQEVIQRIQSGETIGRDKAAAIVNEYRPAPAEARQIARDTGKPTLARDGNIYLGASKAEEKDIEKRRELVFGIRRAVEALSTMEMTPDEFLKYALPHQLWNKTEEHQISEAAEWLTDLAVAWERR